MVVEQQPNLRDTTASLCVYDDGEERWYDLDAETYKFLPPSRARLAKVKECYLKLRLTQERVQFEDGVPKEELEVLLQTKLQTRFKPSKKYEYNPRCKFGHTAKELSASRKRARADVKKAGEEEQEWRLCMRGGTANPTRTKRVTKKEGYRTSTETCAGVFNHGMALHVLSTQGDR